MHACRSARWRLPASLAAQEHIVCPCSALRASGCAQVAASDVSIVAVEDAPKEEIERERAIEMQKEDILSKPEQIRCAQRHSCSSAVERVRPRFHSLDC